MPLEVRMREMKENRVGLKKTEANLHLIYSLSELLPNGLLNARGGYLFYYRLIHDTFLVGGGLHHSSPLRGRSGVKGV